MRKPSGRLSPKKIEWYLDPSYFANKYGISAEAVRSKAEKIFHKKWHNLTEGDMGYFMQIMYYQHDIDAEFKFPLFPANSLKDMIKRLYGLLMTKIKLKEMQLHECIANGYFHEIDQIINNTEFIQIMNALNSGKYAELMQDDDVKTIDLSFLKLQAKGEDPQADDIFKPKTTGGNENTDTQSTDKQAI